MHNERMEDDPVQPTATVATTDAGGGAMGATTKLTVSYWTRNTRPQGTDELVDLNFAHGDNSVSRVLNVQPEDPRLSLVPFHISGGNAATRRVQLPASQ